jgi:hypothetical protein
MRYNLKIITRVAIFASLVFIFSYFSVFLYNVNPAFFIVFSAGLLWGIVPGIGVGIIGFFLWSNFNPMGPAPLPILLSQLIGISFSSVVGYLAGALIKFEHFHLKVAIILSVAGLLCGLLFHLVVDAVDAWIYQPFWPRFIGGLLFSLITIVSNSIIFPALYPALAFLQRQDK